MSGQHTPRRAGVWWASFDDGERVTEVALLHVECYHGEANFESGGIATFLDGTRRYFSFRTTASGAIVRPGVEVATGSGLRFSGYDEWRITWISEVKKPRGAPQAGTAIARARGDDA